MKRCIRIAVNTCGGRNSVYIRKSYIDAIERDPGARVELIPVGISDTNLYHALFECDGLLLTGGPDIHPSLYNASRHRKTSPGSLQKAKQDIKMFRLADRLGLPVLGICAGMQTINIARGGTLIQDIPSCLVKPCEHQGKELFHRVYFTKARSLIKESLQLSTKLTTNSRHHQCVGTTGKNLIVGARTTDGVIEEIEDFRPDKWIIGVQWHPEDLTNKTYHSRLFREFLYACELSAGG